MSEETGVVMGMPAIGINPAGQQAPRLPANPLDKSTVISIHHAAIDEIKSTIWPGRFQIPAAKDDDFELLVVTSSSYWMEVRVGQPLVEVVCGSTQVAKAVVDDFNNSVLGTNMGDRTPGLFWVPGAWTKKNISAYQDPTTGETFKAMLDRARARQKQWYNEIVQITDVMWTQSSNNPLSVSIDAKTAAKRLGLTKPWMADNLAMDKIHCKACGELVNPMFPVCKFCKAIIDEDRAKDLKIKFAV